MVNDLRNYLISGAYAVLNDLASQVDSIDRTGQEQQLFRDRIVKGRLSHFSVAAKKDLEKNLISAIMSIDTKGRGNRRTRGAVVLLRSRKKRVTEKENSDA